MNDECYTFPALRITADNARKILSGAKRWEFRSHSLPHHTMLMVDGGRVLGLIRIGGFIHTPVPAITVALVRKFGAKLSEFGVSQQTIVKNGWNWAYIICGAAPLDADAVTVTGVPRRSGASAVIRLPQGRKPFLEAVDRLTEGTSL